MDKPGSFSSNNQQSLRQRRGNTQKLTRSGSHVFLPRMVLRNLPYHQSQNQCQVKNAKSRSRLSCLLLSDWFHVLLRMPLYCNIVLLLSTWVGMILFFAGIYIYVDTSNKNIDCGLGLPGYPLSLAAAFAFSLETCTTVGYTLPGSTMAFFEQGCPGVQVAIFFQMIWSMMFNAFLFAFFYSQLSKSERRSAQLVFSDKLCINVRDGKVCATVQCYDIDSAFPLVESHARMYLLDHKLQMHQLRLISPNDDLGGMVYPSIPAKITHQIDHHSKLSPRMMPLIPPYQGLMLRNVDSTTCNREEVICPVCGEAYGTYERLLNHVRYNRIVEQKDKFPRGNTHLDFEMPDTTAISLQEVTEHIEQTFSEIIVVVEAIDPQLSGTFQSIQSYKYEDIAFGADFEKNIFVHDNKFAVDMKAFHKVQYDPEGENDDDSIIAFQLNTPHENATDAAVEETKGDKTTDDDGIIRAEIKHLVGMKEDDGFIDL